MKWTTGEGFDDDALAGDDFTDRDTVETYLLFRAAELTAVNGAKGGAIPST